jgi:hypothetical protein
MRAAVLCIRDFAEESVFGGALQISGFLPGSRNFARQRPVSVRAEAHYDSEGKPRSRVEGMHHWIHDRAAAFNSRHRSAVITDRRSASAAQEDSVMKLLLAGLLAMVGLAPTFAGAQTQAEEKMLVGEVQSIDQTGTQITLKDGTMLLTPPGSMLKPGALEQGMLVVAMYREQENGDKVLTRLSLGHSQPAPGGQVEQPK